MNWSSIVLGGFLREATPLHFIRTTYIITEMEAWPSSWLESDQTFLRDQWAISWVLRLEISQHETISDTNEPEPYYFQKSESCVMCLSCFKNMTIHHYLTFAPKEIYVTTSRPICSQSDFENWNPRVTYFGQYFPQLVQCNCWKVNSFCWSVLFFNLLF